MSNESGLVQTYVLGIADDVASTKRLITLFRVTHWVFFLIAVGAAVKFAHLYFTRGDAYSEPPEKVIEVLQLVANSLLWLFISGVSLVSGFVTWLNTDVLVNRRMILESGSVTAQAVVKTGIERTAPSETPTTAGT